MFKPAAVCLIFIDTLFKKPIKDFICSVSRCLSDEFVYVFNERSTLTRYHLPSSHSVDDVDTDTLGWSHQYLPSLLVYKLHSFPARAGVRSEISSNNDMNQMP